MSITTGRGDGGETGLIGGTRVPKDDPRLEAYGTVDELNALIGIARAQAPAPPLPAELRLVSEWLFALGSDLATPPVDGAPRYLDASAAVTVEKWIHREEKSLPPLRRFILPGGTPTAAAFHQARTVCRRAERRVVTLHRRWAGADVALVFLNRLSDLLFMYARRVNHDAGTGDVEWSRR